MAAMNSRSITECGVLGLQELALSDVPDAVNFIHVIHLGLVADQFTFSVGNSNPTVLTGNEAVIAEVTNADCSISVTQQQEVFPAGSNYTILFAQDINQTNVCSKQSILLHVNGVLAYFFL